MGKCNLLKPLYNNNGNFFIFSQYTEDLTKEYTQKDTYRVVPSKFIALDLNLLNIETSDNESLDDILPGIFQNYYENHCCFWRGYDKNWTPNKALDLLFQTFEKYQMVTIKNNYYSNLHYIGDINIYSNQVVDGMTYNEIYCYIPNDAKSYKYELSKLNTVISVEKTSDFICGFEQEALNLQAENKSTYLNNLSLNAIYDDDKNFYINNNYNLTGVKFENTEIVDKFNINTIIVLYDIIDNTGTIKYTNIPMGIYFTGKTTNGFINNAITKYISNGEIYDQGTSYGLRICTRYLSQPNIEIFQDNVTIEIDSTPENLTELFSKIAESQVLMETAVNKTVENTKNFKDFYALFKNSNVNVPYIETVAGEPYWFVNGKNTEVKVLDISKINITSITNNELNNVTIEQCLKKGVNTTEIPEYKYLDFNQLNSFAKSINSEFLQKNQGVTKQELLLLATKEYVDTNFARKDSIVNTNTSLNVLPELITIFDNPVINLDKDVKYDMLLDQDSHIKLIFNNIFYNFPIKTYYCGDCGNQNDIVIENLTVGDDEFYSIDIKNISNGLVYLCVSFKLTDTSVIILIEIKKYI